jgi:hypothetical protein
LNPLGAPLAGRGRHVRAFPGRSTDPSIVRNQGAVQQAGSGLECDGDGVVYTPSTGSNRSQLYARELLCIRRTSRPGVPGSTDRDIQPSLVRKRLDGTAATSAVVSEAR